MSGFLLDESRFANQQDTIAVDRWVETSLFDLIQLFLKHNMSSNPKIECSKLCVAENLGGSPGLSPFELGAAFVQ